MPVYDLVTDVRAWNATYHNLADSQVDKGLFFVARLWIPEGVAYTQPLLAGAGSF